MRQITEILNGTKYKPEQAEYFLAECYLDFLYFAEHVLGFDIADYHREWYDLKKRFKRLSIIAFRGSGKTFFFSGYYIWKSIFRPGNETLIISNTLEQAKYVLKVVRTMIADNELLKQFMPQSKEASWKATELGLANGSIFYCKPYNENIRSIHPDEVLCDEAGEYEDKSIFWTAILGTIQLKMGRVVVIGTPKSAIDLLAELKENGEYMTMEYPAEKDGKVLWDAKYTMENQDKDNKRSLLSIRREMGELPYTQEYLLIPISSANSLFPYELTTKALVTTEGFIPYGRVDERYYIGYDLAISLKGDYTVMSVLGVNSDRKKLVKAIRIRDSFEEQKRRLRQLYEDFHPNKIMIDATGLGEQQAKELQQEIPCVEPKKITYDEKYKMLMDLRQEFEKHNVVLPYSKDNEAYTFTQTLVQELNDFTMRLDMRSGQTTRPKFHSGKHDDCVISLALANAATISPYGDISIRGIE